MQTVLAVLAGAGVGPGDGYGVDLWGGGAGTGGVVWPEEFGPRDWGGEFWWCGGRDGVSGDGGEVGS